MAWNLDSHDLTTPIARSVENVLNRRIRDGPVYYGATHLGHHLQRPRLLLSGVADQRQPGLARWMVERCVGPVSNFPASRSTARLPGYAAGRLSRGRGLPLPFPRTRTGSERLGSRR